MNKLLFFGVLILAAILITGGITWGLPNIGSWSADDSSGTVDLAWAMRLGSTDHKYPPLQKMIKVAAYSPFVGWWYLTGSFKPATEYPYGFSDIYSQLGTLIFMSRFVVAIMALAAVWLVWKIVLHLTKSSFAATTAALALLFNYWFLHFSKTGNVDVPMLLWLLAATYCWLHALEQPKKWWYVGTAVFCALAMSTKDVAIAFVAPMIALLVLVHFVRGWRSRTPVTNVIFHPSLLWAALAGIVVYGVASLFFFYPHQIIYRLNLFSGSGWGVAGYDQGNWLAVLARTVWLSWTSMGWPLFGLGCVGAVWAMISRKWLHISLLVPLVGYYLIDIGRIGFVFDRHVMPIVMVMALFSGLAVSYVMESSLFKNKHANPVIVLSCFVVFFLLVSSVLFHSFLVSTTANTQMKYDSRYAVEEFIKTTPEAATMMTFDVSTWQPRYELISKDVLFVHPANISVDGIEALKPDYIIFSENMLKSRLSFMGFGAAQETVDALFAGTMDYTLVRTFGNETLRFSPARDTDKYAVQRIDPVIWIYKRGERV